MFTPSFGLRETAPVNAEGAIGNLTQNLDRVDTSGRELAGERTPVPMRSTRSSGLCADGLDHHLSGELEGLIQIAAVSERSNANENSLCD